MLSGIIYKKNVHPKELHYSTDDYRGKDVTLLRLVPLIDVRVDYKQLEIILFAETRNHLNHFSLLIGNV